MPTLRKAAAALALLPLLALTACSGGSPDDLKDADEETVVYRGEVITCLETDGSKSAMLTCDFHTFYYKHPDLLKDASVGEEEGVIWLASKGKPLACIKRGGSQSGRMACDWDRFYAANPELSSAPR